MYVSQLVDHSQCKQVECAPSRVRTIIVTAGLAADHHCATLNPVYAFCTTYASDKYQHCGIG